MLTTHLSSPYEPSGNDSGCWGPTHPPFKVYRHAFPLSRRSSYLWSREARGSKAPGRDTLLSEPVDLPHSLQVFWDSPCPIFCLSRLSSCPSRKARVISPKGLVFIIDGERQIAFAFILAKIPRGGMYKRVTKPGYLLKMRRKRKL